MVGDTRGRRSLAAGVLLLAGCVGLGDSPSDTVTTNRPRPRARAAAEQPDTPELRIADEVVAQAKGDIPVVPVPPVGAASRVAPGVRLGSPDLPPVGAASRAAPGSPAPFGSRGVPAPQADGTRQTPPHTARQLLQQAASRCATLDSYIVRLTRREQLKGKAGPEEIIALSFRKNPFSVHFKWLGDTAKGREVVYVKGRFDNKIHTKVAAGDALLMPAGSRLSLSPDNPLVRSASRHPITDAGICHCVESLNALLDAQERGDRRQGTLTAITPQRRPEYPQPIEALERLIPPNVEPELPRGGRRLIYFDPDWQLPLLVATYDDKGQEVEYYRYDRLMTPANLDDDDFNPDKLWAAPKAEPRR
jgi:hypothetical protein